MGEIIWNGIPSSSVGIVVEHEPVYVSPVKDYDVVHVLGKSGDILMDNDSYQNIEQPYDIAFGSLHKTHSEMAQAVSGWLHSADGYAKLEDTYSPEIYRMAYYQEGPEFENILNHLGRATITFNCMPQRFFKNGDTKLIFNSKKHTVDGSILNPTNFIARPLIKVSTSGREASFSFLLKNKYFDSKTLFTFRESATRSVMIDSELGEFYVPETHVSLNEYVEWPEEYDHSLPVLAPGANYILITAQGDISGVNLEVTPRWYTM